MIRRSGTNFMRGAHSRMHGVCNARWCAATQLYTNLLHATIACTWPRTWPRNCNCNCNCGGRAMVGRSWTMILRPLQRSCLGWRASMPSTRLAKVRTHHTGMPLHMHMHMQRHVYSTPHPHTHTHTQIHRQAHRHTHARRHAGSRSSAHCP